MLHVERVLQHSEALCCTWSASCNIQGCYVARGACLATFGGAMLHVGLVLQHSGTLIAFSSQTCQQRYSYCHFSPNVSTTILLLSLLAKRVNNSTLIVTSHQTCQQRHSYCHFSPNVSTTTLLLSLLAKRVSNSTLIVTSHQTCQQQYSYCLFLPNVSTIISQQHHNYALPYTSFTTSPDFLPRYSIHTNIYIKKDLFVWIRKRKGPFSY